MANRIGERLEKQTPIEWWYVHGKLRGSQLGERYFMVSLFRFQLTIGEGRPLEACSALISVLDPATGRHRTSSRADRRLLTALGDRETARQLDPHSPTPVLDELLSCGLPREFESPEADPEFSQEPFCCRWDDLMIGFKQGDCQLSFREPESGLTYDLDLHPETPRLVIEAATTVGSPEQAMNYAAFPRLTLTGSAGGSPVTGNAWFDHQWGGWAWLKTEHSPPRPLGWDWLSFHLDDGSSCIVMRQWDVAARDELFRCLTLRKASGEVEAVRPFDWTPARWWNSPSTRISYPVEWRLQAREFGLDVTFSPLADHQEIRVFSPMRAVWQGAGIVRGRAFGRAVEMDARLEGQGYGYILSPSDYLERWGGHVDGVVSRFLPPASKDGKRWLAILLSLLLEAVGQDPEFLRKGRLSGKQRVAIWSAYLRLILRQHLLANRNTFRSGQLDRPTLDLWMQDSLGPRIRAMYAKQSGVSAEELVGLAEAIARLEPEARCAIQSFVGSLGLALQLVSDAEGFSDAEQPHKPRGADLAAGKLNYVIFRALQVLPPDGGERVRNLLCNRAMRADTATVAEGIDLVANSGACESVREEACEIFRHAWREFSSRVRPSIAKTEIRLLAESLLE